MPRQDAIAERVRLTQEDKAMIVDMARYDHQAAAAAVEDLCTALMKLQEGFKRTHNELYGDPRQPPWPTSRELFFLKGRARNALRESQHPSPAHVKGRKTARQIRALAKEQP